MTHVNPFLFDVVACRTLRSCLLTLFGVGQRRVEKRRHGREHRIRAGRHQEMIATGKHSKTSVWNEPEHFHCVFGAYDVAIAEASISSTSVVVNGTIMNLFIELDPNRTIAPVCWLVQLGIQAGAVRISSRRS